MNPSLISKIFTLDSRGPKKFDEASEEKKHRHAKRARYNFCGWQKLRTFNSTDQMKSQVDTSFRTFADFRRLAFTLNIIEQDQICMQVVLLFVY